MKKPHVTAALLMGGTGLRFNSPIPKQFLLLGGKPVYLHALETLIASQLFDEILIVCHKDFIHRVEEETKGKARVIEGGLSRQASSYAAIIASHPSSDYILFHDAVRPFITTSLLEAHIAEVIKHSAVDTCIPATDTMVCSQDGKMISSIPPRAQYFRGQTPQSFALPLIQRAHEEAMKADFTGTDDCGLIFRLGEPLYMVEGSEENMKITTEIDLHLAEQILRLQKKQISPSENKSLEGKIYIICGGNGCIGSAIAKALYKEKATTLIVSRTSRPFSTDLSDPIATKKVFDQIHKEYGDVDGLINCAGDLLIKPFKELSQNEINQLLGSNLLATINACKYAHLKKEGHIVNISSSSYTRGRKDYILYTAAKAAVVNFTQGLSQENPHLFINVIAPQRTSSSMRKRHFPEETPHHLLDPGEIANEVSLLLKSKETGLIIDIKQTTPQS